jgi:hypothetical protein
MDNHKVFWAMPVFQNGNYFFLDLKIMQGTGTLHPRSLHVESINEISGDHILPYFPSFIRRMHPPRPSHSFHLGHFSLMQGIKAGLKSGFR